MNRKLIAITAALVAAFVVACSSAPGDPNAKTTTSATQAACEHGSLANGTCVSAEATPRTTTVQATAAAAPTTQSLTNAQKQAIGKAQSYLSFTAFSRKGLIKQLEFEGFATADATFAVDSLKVDWKAQAAAKGKSYLDMQHFSRKGLIDQLKYDGFTADEAAYGATANGL